MMHSANNGHHPHHPPVSHPPHHHHPPPHHPSHLDSRYMDYATAMAASPHHSVHLGAPDPHALHYAAAAVSLPPQSHPLTSGSNKRHATDAGGMDNQYGESSEDDDGSSLDVKPPISSTDRTGNGRGQNKGGPDPVTGKKTKGRVKIKMEFIDNKLRRYTTFSKRKTGIMKKAYELSTLTGTQVMLLVASETGHVYTFATRKLQPMITSDAGKALIQTCLNSPDPSPHIPTSDQRMSATGYEETELTYNIADDEQQKELNEEEDENQVDGRNDQDVQQNACVSDEVQDEGESDEDYNEERGLEQPEQEQETEFPKLSPKKRIKIRTEKSNQLVVEQSKMRRPNQNDQNLVLQKRTSKKSSRGNFVIEKPVEVTGQELSRESLEKIPPKILKDLISSGRIVRQKDGSVFMLPSNDPSEQSSSSSSIASTSSPTSSSSDTVYISTLKKETNKTSRR